LEKREMATDIMCLKKRNWDKAVADICNVRSWPSSCPYSYRLERPPSWRLLPLAESF